jgi:hypothetical protein
VDGSEHHAGEFHAVMPLAGQPDGNGATFWSPFRAGVRQAAGLPSLVLMASLIGVGGLTRDIGYPMWAGVLSTMLLWAGPAQVLLFGSLAAGASLPAIAVAVSLSSIRFFPMVVSLLPLLRGPAVGTGKLLIAAHFVAVTAWTEGRRLLPGLPVEQRYPFFIGFSIDGHGRGDVRDGGRLLSSSPLCRLPSLRPCCSPRRCSLPCRSWRARARWPTGPRSASASPSRLSQRRWSGRISICSWSDLWAGRWLTPSTACGEGADAG